MVIVFPPDVFTVNSPEELFSIRNPCPVVSVEATGNTTVCVVLPTNDCMYVLSTVSVVVPAADVVLVKEGMNVFAVTHAELILAFEVPAMVAYRFVPSPPNPVVEAPLCGINEGAVEEEAPEPIEGVVVNTEFITSHVTHELHVTEAGVIA